jgi:hypothetical protein
MLSKNLGNKCGQSATPQRGMEDAEVGTLCAERALVTRHLAGVVAYCKI